MKEVIGRIHSVESFGALDGPGIRYILFLQGCPLRCAYCHNPDSWVAHGGRERSSAEVVKDVLRYRSFLSTGGVTLSGGEPLMQPDFCEAVIRDCHREGIHVALDTAGSVPLAACRSAVEQADLLLLDIKSADEEQFRDLTGGALSNTLQVLNLRERLGKPVWIRHVVVPGLTLEDARLHALGELLQPYTCIERVDLLPFHKLGEFKWKSLELLYTLEDTPVPTDEEMSHACAILAEYGFLPGGKRLPDEDRQPALSPS